MTTTTMGGSGGLPTPFQTPPVKMMMKTTNSTMTSVHDGGSSVSNLSHSFHEMEMLDISVLVVRI